MAANDGFDDFDFVFPDTLFMGQNANMIAQYPDAMARANIQCEACHGPASAHLAWANGDRSGSDSGADSRVGFPLDDRGAFGPGEDGGAHIWSRQDGRRPVTQIEACAGCHSRRSELGQPQVGESFDDQYRLALLEPGLYFPDGQVLDEVYVYGSFLQSKMFAAGVVCTDCHEPHSNGLLAEGTTSKQKFGDHRLHIEFQLPYQPENRGQAP